MNEAHSFNVNEIHKNLHVINKKAQIGYIWNINDIENSAYINDINT